MSGAASNRSPGSGEVGQPAGDPQPSKAAPSAHRRPVVDLVYFNAGGGHRASALALAAALEREHWGWTVRLLNLRDMLDPGASFKRWTGMEPEDLYNRRLARGWTLGLAQELKLLQGVIRWRHAALCARLAPRWQARRADLVVSLIPNFNRALADSLAQARPGVPFVTVMTDLADHPPHFWIEPGLHRHLVCGSDRARQQAREAGLPDGLVHRASGMLLRADFHRSRAIDRAAERRRHGLDAERFTGIVLFGGQGSRHMLRIARKLPDTQLILVCGHNAALAQALREMPANAPRHIVEFTDDIPGLMQLADFFIGKPGPGSLSEAVQMQLPVIVVRDRWTLPQERYNARWVLEHGVGLVIPSFARIAPAVASLQARHARLVEATRRVVNRASFELPGLLRAILEDGHAEVGVPPSGEPAGATLQAGARTTVENPA